MNDTIEITVNGQKENVAVNSTLSFLIRHFKEYDTDLIVEHNGRFVYPRRYAEVTVREGDIIEFINPNIGG
ncbi:MAG: sulfur carrier protein ThiS [Desulfobacteraceae bacterium]|nr:MAG: sulfur carrier protein ThiS [Desulfobacteraceae bacterium]